MKGFRMFSFKRIIFTVILCSFFSVFSFARGGNESEDSLESASIRETYTKQWNVVISPDLDDNEPESYLSYTAFFYRNMGKNQIEMVFDEDEKPTFAIVRIDNEYFNGFTGEQVTIEGIDTLLSAEQSGPDFELEQISVDPMNVTEITPLTSWPTELQRAALRPRNVDNVVNLFWSNQADNEVIDVALFIEASGGSSRRAVKVSAQLNTEFFPGEREFFASHGSGTYKQKALALMNMLIGDDFSDKTGSVMSTSNISWNMFDSVDSTHMEQILQNLKISIGQHFAFKFYHDTDLNIPYLEFGRSEFDAIYGKDYNVYIKSYLDYCYRVNKPPLAYLVHNSLNPDSEGNDPEKANFNYNEYRHIEPDEGDDIVKSALRYLTWGVEYTANTVNTVPVPQTGASVYKDNLDTIREWIGESGTDAAQQPQYAFFPGYTSDDQNELTNQVVMNEVTGTTHTIRLSEGQNSSSFVVAGRKSQESPFNIERVEMWTAQNVLKNGTTAEIILVNDSAISTATQGNLLDGNLSTTINNISNVELSLNETVSIKAITFIGRPTGEIEEISVEPDGSILNDVKLIVSNSEEKVWEKNPDLFPTETFETYTLLFSLAQTTDTIRILVEGSGSFEISEVYVFDENPIAYINTGLFGPAETSFNEVIAFPNVKADTVHRYEDRFEVIMDTLIFNAEVGEYKSLNGSGVVIANDECNVRGKATATATKYELIYGQLLHDEIIEIWDNIADDRYETRRNDGLEGSNLITTNDIKHYKETFLMHLPLVESNAIKEIVVYESGTQSVLTEPLRVFTGPNQLLEDVFVRSQQADTSTVSLPLTTPFRNSDGEIMRGNSIPFSWRGFDNPRSFAYKMHNQVQARTFVNDDLPHDEYTSEVTTKALDSGDLEYFHTGYVSGRSLNDYSHGKPYLPGIRKAQDYRFSYLHNEYPDYVPDKVAGVDAPGLLAGVLSMTENPGIFYNLFNEQVGAEYQKYLGMEADATGTDNSGEPLFETTEETSGINGTYRITWKDIEKMTTLVPDISELQNGDLLVSYGFNEDDNEHIYDDYLNIGIVVKTGWGDQKPAYGTGYGDNDELLNQVYVLTTAPTIEAVTLGTWGSSAGIYGGLTTNPKQFQIRRLLASDSHENTIAAKDDWEALDNEIAALAVDIRFPNDSRTNIEHDMTHWIPNTGEIHPIGQIEIGSSTGFGISTLNESMRDIVLKSPADMYYNTDSNAETAGNIYNNAGTNFEFYAIEREGDNEGVRIATFTFVSPANRNRNNTYNVEYNPAHFELDGAGKPTGNGSKANYLRVDANNMLWASINGKTYNTFGIKAVGTIRPGDDILLRFGLLNDTSDEPVIGEVSTGDFLAVYDKKMLWRANLYIAETGIDWNDVHPWDDPVNNEWYSAEGTNGSSVNGGQINIRDWTSFRDNRRIENAVAYAWGGGDDIDKFNEKMDAQRDVLSAYYAENQNEIIPPNGDPAEHQDWSPWDATTAPESNWNNYIFTGVVDTDINYSTCNIDGQEYMPYRPGFSVYRYINGSYNSSHVKYSAGIDCSSFVQRNASYNDNIYALVDYSGFSTWDDDGLSGQRHSTTGIAASTRSILISENADEDEDLLLLSRLIPGDILILPGEHVIFVQNINLSGSTRSISSLEQIELIHATSGYSGARNQWKVMKNPCIPNDYQNYQFRRLRGTE